MTVRKHEIVVSVCDVCKKRVERTDAADYPRTWSSAILYVESSTSVQKSVGSSGEKHLCEECSELFAELLHAGFEAAARKSAQLNGLDGASRLALTTKVGMLTLAIAERASDARDE